MKLMAMKKNWDQSNILQKNFLVQLQMNTDGSKIHFRHFTFYHVSESDLVGRECRNVKLER